MDRTAAKRWFIDGYVQGVGFRDFVRQKATSLGLTVGRVISMMAGWKCMQRGQLRR